MRIGRVLRIAVTVALASFQGCRASTAGPLTPPEIRAWQGTPVLAASRQDSTRSGIVHPDEEYVGKFALTLRPALFTLYRINGRFQSMDFVSGDPITSTDSGDIVGQYGFGLQLDYQPNHWLAFSLGADTRAYDVKGINPIPELNVAVESIDSTQFFLAARNLLPPLDAGGRFQPFLELSLSYLPGVDVGFEVDLSEFGSSNLMINSHSNGFFLAGFTLGAFYNWSRHWRLQFGTTYERPLTDMEVDLSFELANTTVPLTAEFEPLGWIGFFGLSYVF